MNNIQNDFISGIGNTPLIKLRAASEITGCNIYGKAEFLNPGGSVKDRAALALIKDAQEKKLISKGGTIVEGTAGNTGIGLAVVCKEYGLNLKIVIPKTQSIEKKETLKELGAELIEVDAVPYSDPKNYIKQSKQIADVQIENILNYMKTTTKTISDIHAAVSNAIALNELDTIREFDIFMEDY